MGRKYIKSAGLTNECIEKTKAYTLSSIPGS